jgi:hypothetical protein
MENSKRIGIALSFPRGPLARQDEYGVYESGHCLYEGFRDQRPEGEVRTGLPLGGPNAAHLHSKFKYVESEYSEVSWFNESEKLVSKTISASVCSVVHLDAGNDKNGNSQRAYMVLYPEGIAGVISESSMGYSALWEAWGKEVGSILSSKTAVRVKTTKSELKSLLRIVKIDLVP